MSETGLLGVIAKAFRGRDTRLADLEARLLALERARPPNLADSWRGVFTVVKTYCRGDLVTRQGALWLSLTDDNAEIPGQSQQWKMISKSH